MKVVLFDMDGTLIDSKKDITISVNYVRQTNHNLPPLTEEFVVEAINRKERNLAFEFYQTSCYEERDRVLFEHHYKTQCTQNAKLFDGVEEMLHQLKNANIPMAVATNAPTLFAELMLEAVGIKQFFYQVLGADKAPSKPDPQMIKLLLAAVAFDKVKDKAAWMVGDNPKDIEVASRAGIEAIYASWGFQSECKHPIKAQKPQDVVDIVVQ